MSEDLSRDAYLGGRIHLYQPLKGYRAGVDPVLLAGCIPATPGQSVLDLGCGAGAASLCLLARVSGLAMTGVERQERYADLARRNATENGVEFNVVHADLADLPSELRQKQFDHVIANPPYFERNGRKSAQDAGREAALAEETSLDTWIDVASRRLSPLGYLHVIQRAERLGDLITATVPRLGSLEVLPIAARTGRGAHLVILRARKGGKAPFRLHAPLILHEGTHHTVDAESYVPQIRAVLRDAAPINWPSASKK